MNKRLTTLGSTVPGAILLAMLLLSGIDLHAQQAATKRTLPQMSFDPASVSYPGSAQRQGLQGRVLVAFTITKRGRVSDPVVLAAEPEAEFDSTAIKAVKQVRFTVPDDWEESGDSAYQFQLSVLFKLHPCAAPDCVAPKPHDAADDFLVIAASAR